MAETRMPDLFHATDLRSALEAAEPKDGIRLAVTMHADFIAVGFDTDEGMLIRIRATNRITGQGGSEMGTGVWRETIAPTVLWRPA